MSICVSHHLYSVSPERGIATDSLVQDCSLRVFTLLRILLVLQTDLRKAPPYVTLHPTLPICQGSVLTHVSALVRMLLVFLSGMRKVPSWVMPHRLRIALDRVASTHPTILCCTSAALDEGATGQAAHCVATAIKEGTTLPAGTQAETGFGRRSAEKLIPNVLRSPAHTRESSGKAVPCVTTPAPMLGSPVPRISYHTRDCTSEYASLRLASAHVDTFLSNSSSRAHLPVAAHVGIGESSGQRNIDVSDSPVPHVVPVPVDESSGQRSDGISESPAPVHIRSERWVKKQ